MFVAIKLRVVVTQVAKGNLERVRLGDDVAHGSPHWPVYR